jgi:hypothetical protein
MLMSGWTDDCYGGAAIKCRCGSHIQPADALTCRRTDVGINHVMHEAVYLYCMSVYVLLCVLHYVYFKST